MDTNYNALPFQMQTDFHTFLVSLIHTNKHRYNIRAKTFSISENAGSTATQQEHICHRRSFQLSV